MQCGFTSKAVVVAVVWFAASAIDALCGTPTRPLVEPAVSVRQLHSNAAADQLRTAGNNQSSNVKSVYAVAAILTAGVCLDSVMARVCGVNLDQARPVAEAAQSEERQEQ